MISCALMLAWLLTDLVATYGVIHYRRHLLPLAAAPDSPSVVIIVAIKGISESTPGFLEALANLDYCAYRLVFAVEAESDSAFSLLTALQERLADRIPIDVVVAGLASRRAQKIHNLLAALLSLRDDDRIVVFADADILPGPRWLSELIRPIASHEVAASTGYRWQLPLDRHWPSLVVAAADLSVATAARSWRWNVCWGGSMAIDRSALDRIDLKTLWERAASDDLTLTAALRGRGMKINAPLHALVPSPVLHSWTSLFSFAHRQYLLIRVYAPGHWLFAGWTLCVPALGAATAVTAAVGGHWWTLGVLFASAALLELRLSARRRIGALVLPPSAQHAANATISFARWAWPLIHLIHCTAFLSSTLGHSFTWAGIRYRLAGRWVRVRP